MRVLITGASGFAGGHLARFLLTKKGVEVHGTTSTSVRGLERGVHWHLCDIRDPALVRKVVAKVRPHRLYHLAAQSSAGRSWAMPSQTLSTNILGQLHVLDAVREKAAGCRVLIAGSSEQYGYVSRRETPTSEAAAFRPLSPYGVSKAAQDLLAYQYGRSFSLHIIRTCAFNHSGPGQADQFVVSDFAKQVAWIEAGRSKPEIRVGNLDAVRDFVDVRDVVRAYWMALEKGLCGERYNVASGKGHRIGDILDFFLRRSTVRILVKKDPRRQRPHDVPVMLGDASKLRRATGWRPEIGFERMLMDVLDGWRQKAGKAGSC